MAGVLPTRKASVSGSPTGSHSVSVVFAAPPLCLGAQSRNTPNLLGRPGGAGGGSNRIPP